MVTPSSSYGERRQLTIIFSDIVGSTELSSQLDPEDWHDMVTQYHQAATNVVKQFDGHVSQLLGDGILILFGYPKAHENDAERAVRTGLGIQAEIKTLNESLQKKFGKRLAARVGIHTGEVMIRQEGAESGNIYGETPNVAAKVQAEAEAGTVCISATTQRLVAGFFVVEDLGPRILKGVPEPMPLFRVEQSTGVRSRLHSAARSSLTPFVGRESERNLLMNRWAQAQKGKGQLVMITGEAGIGKSRLLQQFKGDLGGIPHTWIEGESSQYEQDTPFAPTLDLVKNAFHWNAATPNEDKLADLERSFGIAGMDTSKSVPLVSSLFGVQVPPDTYPPLLLSPEQQRLQLLQTLVDWILLTSRQQPTVLVIEDLHFADPSSLEEFVMLGEQIEDTPLMLVFTARPRFQPPWPSRPYHSLLALNRLDNDNVREMINTLLGQLIPPETLNTLVERTDGNPLFAEELSQSTASPRNALQQQIPSTLQDLLMARLDYLGPIKEVAQIGSVLGRAFSHSLLASIANQPEEQLQDSLVKLVESGLVFAEKELSDTNYTFKHALVQEAAYGSLLKSRRRELHRAVATSLKEKFTDLAKQRPELVAHHLTEAGDTEPAVEAWQAAGDFAAMRAAHSEAERHFNKALKILDTLPDTPERAYLELPLQMSLGNALKVTAGFGHEKQFAAYSRARQISEQLGESVQFLIILLNLWGAMNSRSELVASRQIAAEMVRLAEREENNMMLAWGHGAQAVELFAQGKFSETVRHFKQLCEYYQQDEHLWSPFDPKVITSIHAALAHWHVGLADQARAIIREQGELAASMPPSNILMSYLGKCSLHLHLREAEKLLQSAKEITRIATEHEISSYIGWGAIYEGAALIYQDDYEEGIAKLTKGVGDYLASGTHSSLAQYLGVLAEGYAGAGDLEKALATIEDAFGAAGEEHMHLPELHRIKGSLLAQQGKPDEAEREFHTSIGIAKQFESLATELRTVLHLGRLLQSCGRASEARALLAPLHTKFTEGFDAPDMIESKKLLDELSA